MDATRFDGLIAIQRSIGHAGGDLQRVIEAIVAEPSVMPQSNGIVVKLRDADALHNAAASGTSAALVGLRLPLDASLSGLSMLTGHPLYCEDSEGDPRVNREACRRVGLRSMIVVPIPNNGEIVGVIKYHSDKIAAFSSTDIVIAKLLAGLVAMAFSSSVEAESVRVQDELRTAVMMKDQLVSTVSHELRTPLTSIAGALGLLGGGVAGDISDRARALIAIAVRNTDRLRQLVDDLIDMDSIEAGKLAFHRTEADLGVLLQDVAVACAPIASEAGAVLELQLPDQAVMAVTDIDRLSQAIATCVSSACKDAPEHSVVTLTLIADDEVAVIRINDRGTGLPASYRTSLFDPFARFDYDQMFATLPGAGLGLFVAKTIVEGLGGRVRYTAGSDEGATFAISLPFVVAG